MSKKTISVNPDLLSFSKKSRSSNKTKKNKPTPLISPNVMKRNLLQKIKEHKERNNTSVVSDVDNKNQETIELGKFSSEFQDSMDYLKELTQKPLIKPNNQFKQQPTQPMQPMQPMQPTQPMQHSLNKQYQQPQKYNNNFAPVNIEPPENNFHFNTPVNNPQQTYSITVPPENSIENNYNIIESSNMKIPDVPYGCLKNGLKPTYRDWMKKTQKLSTIQTNNFVPPNNTRINEIKQSLINKPIATQNLINKTLEKRNKRSKYLIKRTQRKKYTLGKRKKNRTISVLIKGSTLRNKIIQEKIGLNNKSIQEIKNYLKKHGLIKAGSSCPDDVLRKMYESAVLTGHVKNKNKDILLHNFLND